MLNLLSSPKTLFDFVPDADLTAWYILDDVVMGGRSGGSLKLNAEGYAEFSGYVSLENNGGFSSVRYRFNAEDVKDFTTVRMRVKGDGKRYQFRVKDSYNSYYSYIQYFETDTEWETIDIKLEDMYPSFRGRRLNFGNFSSSQIEELSILISNKKNESFELLIDKIELIP